MCDRFLCQNCYICRKLLTFHSVNVCMMSYFSLALIRQSVRKQIRKKIAGVNMFMITVMFSGKTHARLIQHQCFLCFWYRSLKQIVYFWRKVLSLYDSYSGIPSWDCFSLCLLFFTKAWVSRSPFLDSSSLRMLSSEIWTQQHHQLHQTRFQFFSWL